MSKEGKAVWDYLKGNLTNQVAIYSRLLELLRKENQALINRKHKHILDIAAQKELISPEIDELTKEMMIILNNLVVSNETEQVSLQQVIELAPELYRSDFSQLKNRLKNQKEELMMLRYRNQKLMENALLYVQHMMSKVMDVCANSQQLYCQKGGKTSLENERSWMDIVA